MLPLILLSEEITTELSTELETVEEVTNTVMTFTPAQIRLGILVLLVVGLAIYFIIRPTEEKTKSAQEFLNGLATQVMAIILTNIDYRLDGFDGTIEMSFDDFKNKIVDAIYDDAWNFVEDAVKKAVEEGKLNNISAKYIKRESVESLVKLILSRDNIQMKFKQAFDKLIETYNNQALKEEEEDRKFAEECEKAPLDEDIETPSTEEVEAFIPTDAPTDYNPEDIEETVG